MNEVLVDKLQFYSKRWFNRLSLALAILLMFPTIAIMATWNTLPGAKLYPTKRYLENIALRLVGNNFTVRADLQTQFVEQRFSEAETLLSQSSDTGLNELLKQIQATKTDIIEAQSKTGTKNSLVAQKKAEKLAIQLREYNVKLEDKKQAFANEATKVYVTNTIYVNTVVTQMPNNANVPIVDHNQRSTTPVQSVEEAQGEIKIVIKELENAQGLVDNKSDKTKSIESDDEESDHDGENTKNSNGDLGKKQKNSVE